MLKSDDYLRCDCHFLSVQLYLGKREELRKQFFFRYVTGAGNQKAN